MGRRAYELYLMVIRLQQGPRRTGSDGLPMLQRTDILDALVADPG